jgi:hypothetical protein
MLWSQEDMPEGLRPFDAVSQLCKRSWDAHVVFPIVDGCNIHECWCGMAARNGVSVVVDPTLIFHRFVFETTQTEDV